MNTNMADRYDRIRACVLGAAVGDALGAPNEFIKTRKYREQLAAAYDGKWTDDTQLSMALAEAYVEVAGNPDYSLEDAFIEKLTRWSVNPRGGHRAPGNACLAAARGHIADTNWKPPADALGSGAVMRAHIHGCVLPPVEAHYAAEAEAQTTHGLQAAKAAASWAGFISRVLRQGNPDDMRGFLTKFHAREIGLSFDEAEGWTSTSASHVCIQVFKYTDQAERWDLVTMAAGSTGDSDTLGSMMGAVMGAAYGMDVIPTELLDTLEDRPWLEANAKKLFALSVLDEAERE